LIPANLIINADDFGIDRRVSLAIAHCLEKGLINSFSVLPFEDTFLEELLKSLIKRFPEAQVGCHLSLLGLSNLNESPHYYLDFLKLYLNGHFPGKKVYQIWKEQVLSLGNYLGGTDRIAHLDSHQHLHILPGIWPVTVALQKEFGIPRLRVPYESLWKSVFLKFPFGFGLQVLAFARMKENATKVQKGDRRQLLGFNTSTRFTLSGNRHLIQQILARPDRYFELMVHPAMPMDNNPDNFLSRRDTSSLSKIPLVAESQVEEVEELEKLRDFFLSPDNSH
jgi:predicted glycoside hydrolase/deacetylase ChbG (UPF0249 family)